MADEVSRFLTDYKAASTQPDFNSDEFTASYQRGVSRDRVQPETSADLDRKGFVRETAEALGGGVTDAAELWMRAVRAIDPKGGNDIIRDFATFGIDSVRNFVAKHPSLSPDNQVETGIKRWWVEGVRSLVPSLSATIPGIVAGAAGGPIGATIGGGAVSGAIFGLAEFDKFNEEVEERIVELGLSEAEATAMRQEARGPAIFSALTEGGLEAAANALQVKTLGKFLPGRKTLKDLASRPIKDFFTKAPKEAIKSGAKQLALTTPVEVGTEFAQSALETKFRRDVGLTDMDSIGAGFHAMGPAFVTNLLFFGAGKSANAAQRWSIRHSLEDAKANPDKRAKAVGDIANVVRSMDDLNAQSIADELELSGLAHIESGLSIDINNDLGMETTLQKLAEGLQDGTVSPLVTKKLQKTLEKELDREGLSIQERIPAFQMFEGVSQINSEFDALQSQRKTEEKEKVSVATTEADRIDQNAEKIINKKAEGPRKTKKVDKAVAETTEESAKKIEDDGVEATDAGSIKDKERDEELRKIDVGREEALKQKIKGVKEKGDKLFEEQAKKEPVKEELPPAKVSEASIKQAKKELKDPDLTPEDRADLETILKDAGVAIPVTKAKVPVEEEKVDLGKPGEPRKEPTGEFPTLIPRKKGQKDTAQVKTLKTVSSDLGKQLTILGAGNAKQKRDAKKKIKELQTRRDELRKEISDGIVKEGVGQFTTEAIEIANKTSRSAGAVGGKATVVTKLTQQFGDRNSEVLDFGAGKGATQSELLRKGGFTNVTSHDFGTNVIEGIHDPKALDRQFDVVQVSNVLNVQSTEEALKTTLGQIAGATKSDGFAVLNYPDSPRKAGLTPAQIENEIRVVYANVQKVGRNAWVASKPIQKEVEAVGKQLDIKRDAKINTPIAASALVKTAQQEGVRVDKDGLRTVGDSISATLVKDKRISLVGQTVSNATQLATLAQVYRNPQYETFRYIYVKGRKIVGHEGRTSRLPGTVQVFGNGQERELETLRAKIKELGADSVYLLHNHPSGNPTPSTADTGFTKSMMDRVPEIKRHVIIDSGRFSFIRRDGTIAEVKIETDDAILQPSVPNELLGERVTGHKDVIKVGKQLQVEKGWFTVLYAGTTLQIRGILEVPVAGLKNIKKFTGQIRKNATTFGATSAILVLDTKANPEIAGIQLELIGMIENQIVEDVILMNGTQAISLRSEFDIIPERQPKRFIGEDVQTFIEEPKVAFDKDEPKKVKFEAKHFDRKGLTAGQQKIFETKLGPIIQGETVKERLGRWTSNWKLKIQQGVVDQYASLKKLDDRLWKLAQLTTTSSGAVEALLTIGAVKLTEGIPDIKDPKGGKGLFEVLRPLGGELELFLGWIAGNRSAQLIKEKKERNLSKEEIRELQGLDEGTMKDGRSRKSVYRKALREFNVIHQSVLDVAVETGTINKEERSTWNTDFYLPFFRFLDEKQEVRGPKTLGGVANQTAFKKLEGKDVPIADMLTNIILNWNHLIGASMKNQVASKTVNMAVKERFPDGEPLAVQLSPDMEVVETEAGEFEVIITDTGKSKGRFETVEEAEEHMVEIQDMIAMKRAKQNKNAIFVREDGKKVWYEINEPNIYQALTNLNFEGFNSRPMKAMRKFKRMLTFGVTASPEFKVRNLFRDTITSAAVSNISLNMFDNVFGTGRKAVFGESESSMRMMAGGGSIMMGHLYGTDPEKLQAQLAKNLRKEGIIDNPTALGKLSTKVNGLIDKWNDLGSKMENLNRGALFSQSLENKGFLEANFGARDLLDFNRHGAWPAVRFLIDVVPFMNARIQGLDKLKRSATGTRAEKQRLAVIVGGVAMASMALYLAFKDDEEFKEREDWDRDTYWWFKLPGDKTAIRLPKPFEIGAIGTLAERLLEQFVDDKAHGELFAERLKFAVTETFALGITPQAAKPVLELMANRNFFTERPIESLTMQNLSPTQRRKAWTSETAIGMSFLFSKIPWEKVQLSPVQIEHLVQGYLGWVGATALGTVDQVLTQPLGGFPGRPSRRIEEFPLIGSFVRTTPSRQTKYATLFYEGLKEMNQTYADIRNFRMLGETEKAINLAKKEKDTLRFRKLANKIQKNIANVTKRIRLTRLDKNLSAKEKRVKLDRLTVTKNKLLKMAVKRVGL